MTQIRLAGFDDRLATRGDLKLAEDVGHLIADGFGTQTEFFGDSRVDQHDLSFLSGHSNRHGGHSNALVPTVMTCVTHFAGWNHRKSG